jgi:membrane-bound lytic murein transglycosylase B
MCEFIDSRNETSVSQLKPVHTRLSLTCLLPWLLGLTVLGGCTTFTPSFTSPWNQRPDVQQFIDEVSVKDNFNRDQLNLVFADVQSDPAVLAAITKPAEGKPWVKYHAIFIQPKKIAEGREFWNTYADDLQRAEKIYGVSPSVIIAILDVETEFGKHCGNYNTLNALSTLAFDYPPRSDFFKQELEQYLLLCREQHFDPKTLKASYAGALGLPQFMPSSYRQYAIDFDQHGQADLISNPHDAIGSIANYLKMKGWHTSEPVAMRAIVQGNNYLEATRPGKQPTLTVAELRRYGIRPEHPLPENTLAKFIPFEGANSTEYWLTFHNFYVITRYNNSILYAMAAHQLGQAIKASRQTAMPT